MTPKPWEKHFEENSKAYQAFCLYRDMGPYRTLEKCTKEIAESWQKTYHPKYIRNLSAKHNWVERSEAYDEYLEKIIRETNEEAIPEMVRRHAEDSKDIQTAIKDLKDDPKLDEMTPKEKAYFFDALSRSYANMARLERLSRGVPTENIKQEKEFKEVKNDAITKESLEKPEVRKKANQLIRAIADSKSSTHGTGTTSE